MVKHTGAAIRGRSASLRKGVRQMGRGRQKAKQTKVARDLKYNTHAIDVTALQRELSSRPGSAPPTDNDSDEGYEDEYQDVYHTGR